VERKFSNAYPAFLEMRDFDQLLLYSNAVKIPESVNQKGF